MRTPLGALTVSSATSAPALVRLPLMRTVGYGRIIFGLRLVLAARLAAVSAASVARERLGDGPATGSPSGCRGDWRGLVGAARRRRGRRGRGRRESPWASRSWSASASRSASWSAWASGVGVFVGVGVGVGVFVGVGVGVGGSASGVGVGVGVGAARDHRRRVRDLVVVVASPCRRTARPGATCPCRPSSACRSSRSRCRSRRRSLVLVVVAAQPDAPDRRARRARPGPAARGQLGADDGAAGDRPPPR